MVIGMESFAHPNNDSGLVQEVYAGQKFRVSIPWQKSLFGRFVFILSMKDTN